jgi:hypothetical protein
VTCRPFRGGQTGIELWIERFRVEFCLSPPTGLDLPALEVIAVLAPAQARSRSSARRHDTMRS